MNRKYVICILAALTVTAVITGCIVTGTAVITVKLVPDPNPVTITENNFDQSEMEVDLNDDEDFTEYKDKIKDIDNVGFYLSIANNLNSDVTFQLLIDPDTSSNWSTIDEVIDARIEVIFTGLTIPANGSKVIDWDESVKYTSCVEKIKNILESGIFSIYPAAIPRNDFSVTIDSLVVIVTLTGSK